MYGVFIDKYAELFVIDSCLTFKVIKGKEFNSFREPVMAHERLINSGFL